ncbi:MAG: YfhO family protein [Bacteroidales bacterium]|nr:YfhO family protein [Bacteroidales bacterium]
MEFLQDKGSRFESEDAPIIPPNMWMPYGLYSASGQDAVHSLRYNKFLTFVNTGKFNTGDRYTRIVNYDSKLLDFLAIKYVAVAKWKNAILDFEGKPSYKFNNPKFKTVFNDGRTMVLENTKAYPEIFSVKNFKIANSDNDFSKLFTLADLSNTVILENRPSHDEYSRDVKIDKYTKKGSFVSFSTFSDSNSFVVITISYLPGWNVYIDGKKQNIYRSDYTFIGVEIPSGNHEVVLKYEPESFKYGIYGFTVSLLLLILYLLYIKKNHTEQE